MTCDFADKYGLEGEFVWLLKTTTHFHHESTIEVRRKIALSASENEPGTLNESEYLEAHMENAREPTQGYNVIFTEIIASLRRIRSSVQRSAGSHQDNALSRPKELKPSITGHSKDVDEDVPGQLSARFRHHLRESVGCRECVTG